MADPATTSGGRTAPTVSAVQLDKRTLDAIIAGVAAQLWGPGTGEGMSPNAAAGGPSPSVHQEGEHIGGTREVETPSGSRGGWNDNQV